MSTDTDLYLIRETLSDGAGPSLQTIMDARATLLVAIVLVCAGVALAQVGIGLAARHGTAPRYLAVSPRRAQALLAGAIVALVIVALAIGCPCAVFSVPTKPCPTKCASITGCRRSA